MMKPPTKDTGRNRGGEGREGMIGQLTLLLRDRFVQSFQEGCPLEGVRETFESDRGFRNLTLQLIDPWIARTEEGPHLLCPTEILLLLQQTDREVIQPTCFRPQSLLDFLSNG